jgi:hypothetical protein
MNTIIDTLKLFSDPDALHPFERKPFLYKMSDGKMAAVATDGHRLCLFNSNQLFNSNRPVVTLDELTEPNVESVIITNTLLRGTISVSKLQKAIAKVPIISTEKCCDCHGTGYVDYVFEAHDGEHYWEKLQCPVCGGSGFVGVEDGEEDFDYTYCIRIDGSNFLPKHLKPIADALTAMQIDVLPFIHARHRIQLQNEQFIMLVMECMLDFEHTIDY